MNRKILRSRGVNTWLGQQERNPNKNQNLSIVIFAKYT
jgi:hypothetical protein